jgi:nitrate/nitrite-specific signal transduction histidine kinase
MLEALDIYKQLDHKVAIFTSYKDLSSVYKQLGDQKQARTYANRAYLLAQETGSTSQLLAALELQLDLGNYRNYPIYKKLNDSVQAIRQNNSNRYAALKYNTEQARAEASEAQLKYEQAIFEQERQQGLKLIFMLISVLILSSAILSYFFVRARNRKITLQQVMATENQISRQIHDEVANEVFQVMTRLEDQDLQDPSLIDDMEQLYHKTRDISKKHALLPSQAPFTSQLQDLIGDFSNEEQRILVRGLSETDWNKVSPLKRSALYKVLQELLINTRKHSGASLVALSFSQKDKKTGLSYSDNGCGGPISKGGGLQNAENRIEAIGGSLTFESKAKQGFKAQIYV